MTLNRNANRICQKNLQEQRIRSKILLLCPPLIVIFGLLILIFMIDVKVFSFVISFACYYYYCHIYFKVFAKLNIFYLLCFRLKYFNILDCLILLPNIIVRIRNWFPIPYFIFVKNDFSYQYHLFLN